MAKGVELDIKINQSGNAQSGIESLIDSVGSGIKGAATIATGALALVTGAVVGIGAAAVEAWGQMDEGVDNFTNRTGVTGDALDEVQQSIENLSESAAGAGQSVGNIGDVMGQVASRTGATGKTLEVFTGKMLKLGKVTKGDPIKSTELMTRVMGDWGVAIEDSGDMLDKFLYTSQKTGVGVDELAAQVVQFGAPLRQMGFTMEEAVSMFGKWGKEGVNAELVMGSLRIAAGKFADANIPLRDGLNQTMEAIKNAASESEGLSIAMDTFGARAGPDMAAAIREGRFSIEDYMAALSDSKGVLDDTAEATLDFGDRFGLMKQKVMNSIVPIGQAIMDLGDIGLQFAGPMVDNLTGWIDKVTAKYQEGGIAGVTEMVKADLALLGNSINTQVQIYSQEFWAWLDDAIAKAPANFALLQNTIKTEIAFAWPGIKAELDTWGPKVWDWITGGILLTNSKMAEWTGSISDWITQHEEDITRVGETAGRGFVKGVSNVFSDPKETDSLSGSLATSLGKSIANSVTGIVQFGIDLATGFISGMIEEVTGSDKTLSATIENTVRQAIVTLTPISWLMPVGQDAITGVVNGIHGGTPDVEDAAAYAMSRGRVGAFGQATSYFSVGANADEGIIRGIHYGVPRIEDASRGAARRAYEAAMDELDAHSPSRLIADKVGNTAFAGGFAQGIEEGAPQIEWAARRSANAAAAVATPVFASAPTLAGAEGGTPIIIQLTYAPAVSTADRMEVERVLAPMIADGVRNALAGKR